MRRIFQIVSVALFVVLTWAACSFCCRVLNRSIYAPTWRGYLSQPPNSVEVIGVGSSHMYCMLNPIRMYQTEGVLAYVLAVQQQPIELTYHYLDVAFRTQQPKVVLLESCYAVFCDCWQYDEVPVVHASLDPMPFWQRVAMLDDVDVKNNIEEYLFPILRYHARWRELSAEDFKFGQVSHSRGALLQGIVRPCERKDVFKENVRPGTVPEYTKVWLSRIRDLVESRGARLVLVTAPWCMGTEPDCRCERHLAFRQYAESAGYEHIDFFEKFDHVGLDARNCFSDLYHLNVRGANLATDAISAYLRPRVSFDRRLHPGVKSVLDAEAEENERWYAQFYDELRGKGLLEGGGAHEQMH